jgi:hypothetical protein
MAGLVIAAGCVAFSPPLKAAVVVVVVVVETFTDYAAFLNLLGTNAQVVNFDDVPTSNGPSGFFDGQRYAGQGLVIDGNPRAFNFGASAVSAPNVYANTFSFGGFRPLSTLSFTHDGQSSLTSAFGTFFVNSLPNNYGDASSLLQGFDANGSLLFEGRPELPQFTANAFLGFATVDSSTGELVNAISQVQVIAGAVFTPPSVYLDNFTFATPVPEPNPWALLAATALAAVIRYRRRQPPLEAVHGTT